MKKGICFVLVCLILTAGCSQQVFVTQPESPSYFADYTILLTGEGEGIKADLSIKMAMTVTQNKENLYEGRIEAISLKSDSFPVAFDSKTSVSGSKLDVLPGQTLYFTIPENGAAGMEVSGYDKIFERAGQVEKGGDLLKESQNMIFELFFSRDNFLSYLSFFSNADLEKKTEQDSSWEKQIRVCNPVPYTANAKFSYHGLTEGKHSVSMELPQANCSDFSVNRDNFSLTFSDITVSGSGKYIQNQGYTLVQSDAADQKMTGNLSVSIADEEVFSGPITLSVKTSFIVTEKKS